MGVSSQLCQDLHCRIERRCLSRCIRASQTFCGHFKKISTRRTKRTVSSPTAVAGSFLSTMSVLRLLSIKGERGCPSPRVYYFLLSMTQCHYTTYNTYLVLLKIHLDHAFVTHEFQNAPPAVRQVDRLSASASHAWKQTPYKKKKRWSVEQDGSPIHSTNSCFLFSLYFCRLRRSSPPPPSNHQTQPSLIRPKLPKCAYVFRSTAGIAPQKNTTGHDGLVDPLELGEDRAFTVGEGKSWEF